MEVARTELLPANPDILEGVDDLIQLSYLNEPSVLHNLRFRYSQDMIYVCPIVWLVFSTQTIIYVFLYVACAFCMQSKAGPLLIALNPFKDVPIYGNEYVAAYRKKSLDSPHVYAMVDAAYNEMIGGK
jgi:myosin-5